MNFKHGDARQGRHAAEYKVWRSMHARCRYPSGGKTYERYGGRGIRVCSRWADYARFLSDMGRRPSRKHTIERVNNNRGYSPANCRWATRRAQARNRRRGWHQRCPRGHNMAVARVIYGRRSDRSRCRICRDEYMRRYRGRA